MDTKTTLKALAAATLVAFGTAAAATPAAATDPAIYTPRFSKLALGGYDPVSYFDGAPAKGDARHTTTLEGVEYRFASARNLARFQANPSAFLPQYGGYCAWAVSRGYTAKADPLAWKVVNGKLYLNYDRSVQKRWAADIPGNIAKADKNWPQVLK